MSEPIVILNIDGELKFFSVDLVKREYKAIDSNKVYAEHEIRPSMEEILRNNKVTVH